MSGFGDDFEQGDVDPAADFLAREQNELVGLEDDVKPAAIIANAEDLATNNSAGSFEIIDNLEQEAGLEKREIFDQENDNPSVSEYDFFAVPTESAEFGSRTSPSTSWRQAREETEKIRIWREEQVKKLEKKDEEEEKKSAELREQAKQELADWYRTHAETLAKTKAANRNAEKEFVAEDGEIESGTEWERIAKLCDFNAKAKPGSKDVSRMRSLILHMKQSPLPIKNKA